MIRRLTIFGYIPWMKRHKVLTGLGLLVVLVIAGAASGSQKSTSATTALTPTASTPTPAASPTATATPRPTATPAAPTSTAAPVATTASVADRQAAERALLASSAHYRARLQAGTAIVLSEPPVADADAGLAALEDPNSAESRFTAWRKQDDPALDLSYEQAFKQADSHFTADDEPSNINDWRDMIGNVNGDFSAWEHVADDYQISNASRAQLDAASAKITADLAAADKIAKAIGG